MTEKIDEFYQNAVQAIDVFVRSGQPSLANFLSDHFRKALLLASASYFEKQLTKAVLDFSFSVSKGDQMLVSLVRSKVIDRSYHQWFSWETQNANTFYSMFGDNFKEIHVGLHKNDDAYKKSVLAFLEIGRERNKLVHEDYVTFSFEKSLDEVIQLHRLACKFVDRMQTDLNV